jgi:hypothetical protein
VPIAVVDIAPAALERRPVKLEHRSRAIDALLCRAILEGCRMPLEEGLRLESRLFGDGCLTADMRIGVENFLRNGPRTAVTFVHR